MLQTIEDLKNLLIENNGEIRIGSFKITQGSDVDFYLENKLIGWIPSNFDNGRKLEEDVFSKSADIFPNINDKDERIASLTKEKETLEKELKEAENLKIQVDLSLGKVEAYEKLLIGRDITIGK